MRQIAITDISREFQNANMCLSHDALALTIIELNIFVLPYPNLCFQHSASRSTIFINSKKEANAWESKVKRLLVGKLLSS